MTDDHHADFSTDDYNTGSSAWGARRRRARADPPGTDPPGTRPHRRSAHRRRLPECAARKNPHLAKRPPRQADVINVHDHAMFSPTLMTNRHVPGRSATERGVPD